MRSIVIYVRSNETACSCSHTELSILSLLNKTTNSHSIRLYTPSHFFKHHAHEILSSTNTL